MQKSTQINLHRKSLFNLSTLGSFPIQKASGIDLSENFLTHIEELRRYEYPKLTSLSLSVNVIASIAGLSRCHMPKLQTLELYGNQITDISPLVSIKAENLMYLRLGFRGKGNALKNFEQISSCKFPQLLELTLDFCEVLNIRFMSEAYFPRLVLLYLTGNNIEYIEKTFLDKFPYLHTLSLKQNKLTNVRFLVRSNLPALEYFNISSNLVKELPTFSQCNQALLSNIFFNDNLVQNFAPLCKGNWMTIQQLHFYNFKSIFSSKLYRIIDERSYDKDA